MHEWEVLRLVAEGEQSSLVDYKQELHLDKASEKAELVKDVIALANTSHSVSYLLIGVENERNIVGIDRLNEERIQQIVKTYVTPPVQIQCDTVPVADAGFANVGVIAIRATSRPHKVARAIDRLKQDDVFIKRGSVTFRASPEEIILMHGEATQDDRNIRQLERAAETHITLENFDKAYEAYSRILELSPTAEYFLARAKVYFDMPKKDLDHERRNALNKIAYKDLADAITLSDSFEVEMEARFMRHWKRLSTSTYYTLEQIQNDYDFLFEHLEGVERGEWLYDWMREGYYLYSADEDDLSLVKDALSTGYDKPQLKYLLAEIHCGCGNYGLALKAINRFLPEVEHDTEQYCDFLELKARILFHIGRVGEGRSVLSEIKTIKPEVADGHTQLPLHKDHLTETLCTYLFQYEFSGKIPYPARVVTTFLCFLYRRELWDIELVLDGSNTKQRFMSRLEVLDQKYPGLLQVVEDFLSDEIWEMLTNLNSEAVFDYRFPTFQEIVDEVKKKAS